jgi:hypothetical protein
MKITNGKIIIFIGIAHLLFGISPLVFGKQFIEFANKLFFKISDGLLELPFLNGQINYENFAAFWFFYFGILLIPLGIILDYVEKDNRLIPNTFIWSYFIVVLVGVYMIPLSGMAFFMLPHSIYMLIQSKKLAKGKLDNETL